MTFRPTLFLAALATCSLSAQAASADPRAQIRGDMDAELRRMLERAVGEVDGAPESRFEARRRAQGALSAAEALLRSEAYYQPVLEDVVEGEDRPSAIVDVQPVIRQAARTLGATPLQVTATVIAEARYGILSAVIAAFGRVMAEVGAILIVGGNIAGYTRVMTTTIALETDKGNFELALALGIILLVISFGINTALHVFQRKGIRGVKQWG